MGTLTIKNAYCGVKICFGYLYNFYAVEDTRELTSSDNWSVPSETQYDALISYSGGTTVTGGYLKSIKNIFWLDPNTGATDTYGFSAIGGGERKEDGVFVELKSSGDLWTSTPYAFNPTVQAALINIAYNSASAATPGGYSMKKGIAVRLVKDATGMVDGARTVYIGNDGKVYSAIAINGLYWIMQNLKETKYRDGSYIDGFNNGVYTPISDANWAAKTAGALCVYDDDLDNM